MANGLWLVMTWTETKSGKKIYRKNMERLNIQFGLSSTPLLDGDKLYVQMIHGPWNEDPIRASSLLSINVPVKKSGGTSARPTRLMSANTRIHPPYCTRMMNNVFYLPMAPTTASPIVWKMAARSGDAVIYTPRETTTKHYGLSLLQLVLRG